MKCQGHLGISWGGQKLQIKVCLDVGEGGKVSLSKTKNLLVQVFEKTNSGQKVNGIVSWTKNTPMGPFSWT